MAMQEVAQKGSSLFLKSFSKFFRFFFIFIWIVIPLLYAITISVQASDIQPGLDYIAPKFFSPLETIQDQSITIYEQKGAYVPTQYFWGGIWNFIKFYWVLIGAIWITYKWIWIFASLWGYLWWSDTSKKFNNYTAGLLIFLIVQMFYLTATAPNGMEFEYAMKPIQVIKDFAKSFPYLISEANHVIGNEVIIENKTLENLTNVTI